MNLQSGKNDNLYYVIYTSHIALPLRMSHLDQSTLDPCVTGPVKLKWNPSLWKVANSIGGAKLCSAELNMKSTEGKLKKNCSVATVKKYQEHDNKFQRKSNSCNVTIISNSNLLLLKLLFDMITSCLTSCIKWSLSKNVDFFILKTCEASFHDDVLLVKTPTHSLKLDFLWNLISYQKVELDRMRWSFH